MQMNDEEFNKLQKEWKKKRESDKKVFYDIIQKYDQPHYAFSESSCSENDYSYSDSSSSDFERCYDEENEDHLSGEEDQLLLPNVMKKFVQLQRKLSAQSKPHVFSDENDHKSKSCNQSPNRSFREYKLRTKNLIAQRMNKTVDNISSCNNNFKKTLNKSVGGEMKKLSLYPTNENNFKFKTPKKEAIFGAGSPSDILGKIKLTKKLSDSDSEIEDESTPNATKYFCSDSSDEMANTDTHFETPKKKIKFLNDLQNTPSDTLNDERLKKKLSKLPSDLSPRIKFSSQSRKIKRQKRKFKSDSAKRSIFKPTLQRDFSNTEIFNFKDLSKEELDDLAGCDFFNPHIRLGKSNLSEDLLLHVEPFVVFK